MKRLTILLLLASNLVAAQNTFKAIIRNDKTQQTLPGATATIISLSKGGTADTTGSIIISNIPNGKIEIRFSFVGLMPQEKTFSFPLKKPNEVFMIGLEPTPDELEEVVIQTTRTNQNLRNIPTRIEALPLEELDEKSTMKPGDIKMLLGEATGINVQQTSAVSGSANFRIQGLDSKYTQMLKDGMPLYQGFSGGLSLLQISPLDLKQVEFIKGSASTLYGGGAIAGLINLISKTPLNKPELTFLLNGTSAKGADASMFYSNQWRQTGVTLFTAYNYNGAYDPSNTGLTALPQTERFTINPKVFIHLNDRDMGWLGVNTTYENRYGGDVQVINGHADAVHQYFERNKSFRLSTQLSFTHKLNDSCQVNFKNTIGYFDRELSEPGYLFSGKQLSSFSELNYISNGKLNNWVAGINLTTDNFNDDSKRLNYTLSTLGLFAQNTFKANNWFSLESGIRIDNNWPVSPFKTVFILPRLNGLFKISNKFTSRIGGGLGYKMPTLFNDQSERDGYQNIQPLNITNIQAEQSYGGNADVNFRSSIGDAFISVNQLFFYTHIDKPIILLNNSFVNAPGNIITQGAETNIKLSVDELSLYLGYTYTYTTQNYNNQVSMQTLTPKNKVNVDLTYEIENSFRFGAESYYVGPQLLSDGTTGRGYITFGLLIQKMWKHLDVFINAEDLTDRRQTRWDSIYTGSITKPIFKDIYAPLDGVVVNAGIRIKVL